MPADGSGGGRPHPGSQRGGRGQDAAHGEPLLTVLREEAELALGGYAKRLIVYELLFGSTREHLRRYGAIIADPQVAATGLLMA